MTTIFEVLREDHQTQRTLAELVSKTTGDSDGRRELFFRLRTEALAHAAAEERTLYAAMLALKLTRDKAAHSVKEHQEAEARFEKLEQMGFDNPNWLRSFALLHEELEHHMHEEEHEVFQLAGKGLTETEKTKLVARFRAIKANELAERRAA